MMRSSTRSRRSKRPQSTTCIGRQSNGVGDSSVVGERAVQPPQRQRSSVVAGGGGSKDEEEERAAALAMQLDETTRVLCAGRQRGKRVPQRVREMLALQLLTTRTSHNALARQHGVAKGTVANIRALVAAHFLRDDPLVPVSIYRFVFHST